MIRNKTVTTEKRNNTIKERERKYNKDADLEKTRWLISVYWIIQASISIIFTAHLSPPHPSLSLSHTHTLSLSSPPLSPTVLLVDRAYAVCFSPLVLSCLSSLFLISLLPTLTKSFQVLLRIARCSRVWSRPQYTLWRGDGVPDFSDFHNEIPSRFLGIGIPFASRREGSQSTPCINPSYVRWW